MVFTTAEDVRGPKKLLPKDQASQLMWQSHWAQRQFHSSSGRKITVESEIAADDEVEARRGPVLVLTHESSETVAGQAAAALVESHHGPSGIEGSFERSCLLTKDPSGIVASTPGNRPQHPILGRPTTVGPSTIGLHLFVERRGRTPAEPENPHLH